MDGVILHQSIATVIQGNLGSVLVNGLLAELPRLCSLLLYYMDPLVLEMTVIVLPGHVRSNSPVAFV